MKDILTEAMLEESVSYDSLLTRGASALNTVLSAMGCLRGRGFSLDIDSMNGIRKGATPMLTELPGYPFDYSQRHWMESRISKITRFRQHGRNELLGSPAQDWNPNEARWRMYIHSSENSWIGEQKVGLRHKFPSSSVVSVTGRHGADGLPQISGAIVYPPAGILVMAIEATRQNGRST